MSGQRQSTSHHLDRRRSWGPSGTPRQTSGLRTTGNGPRPRNNTEHNTGSETQDHTGGGSSASLPRQRSGHGNSDEATGCVYLGLVEDDPNYQYDYGQPGTTGTTPPVPRGVGSRRDQRHGLGLHAPASGRRHRRPAGRQCDGPGRGDRRSTPIHTPSIRARTTTPAGSVSSTGPDRRSS